jgi:hypothetical protein
MTKYFVKAAFDELGSLQMTGQQLVDYYLRISLVFYRFYGDT